MYKALKGEGEKKKKFPILKLGILNSDHCEIMAK